MGVARVHDVPVDVPASRLLLLLMLAALAALAANALHLPDVDDYGGESQYEDDDEDDNDDAYASSGASDEVSHDKHDGEKRAPHASSADDGVAGHPEELAGPRRGRHIIPRVSDKAPWRSTVTFDAQVHEALSGTCPPPTGRCSAPRCETDADCWQPHAAHARRRCCHNGCVSTCLLTEDPPLVVDWEEETPDALHPDVPAFSEAQRLAQSRSPRKLHSHGAPEVIALAGGCLLTPTQHLRLEDFKRGKNVRRCFCNKGAVVCQVKAG